MNVLIVYTHPEPQSFNGALLATARRVLAEAGHEVVVSDLYAMNWQPRSDRANFLAPADGGYFKQQAEEAFASAGGSFAPEIKAEIDKLFACDALILQFPLWWFAMPALLKGWVDRVFAMGAVYGGGRWYDRGRFTGKRAMLSLTTGGPQSMYGPDGLNGDIDGLLFPIHNGILRFTGFSVLPPFVAWAPAHATVEQRQDYLAAFEQRLLALWATEPMPARRLDDYDAETYSLKVPAPSSFSPACS